MRAVVLVLFIAGCSHPLAPTISAPTQWALSGQSNAVGLRPALAVYAPVVGIQQNGTNISAWAAAGPLWPTLAASLPHSTAFVWWQGESDAADPAAYRLALDDLMARVEQISGPIPVVICGANANSAFNGLRAVQEADAHAHGWIFVRSDDLPEPGAGDFDVPSQTILPMDFPMGASPHLSQAGYVTMAQRIAAVLEHQ